MSEWNPLELAKKSETFCILPWIHQYVGPPGDIKPCCVYDHKSELGSLRDSTLAEVWNNDTTKKLRLDMLNGVRREECSRCNDREHLQMAFKNGFNENYFDKRPDLNYIVENTTEDGTLEDHKLLYMDARFNNLCNFGCRTCSPHFSTSLVSDHRKLYNKTVREERDDGFQFPGQTEKQLYNELEPHLATLKEVYFAGGEPLMQEDHYLTLDKLVEYGNKNVRIRYNTNFSKLKLNKWDVVEYWKKFKYVTVNASLDGSHERGEYWRKGTVWSETVANRERMLKECPHVLFTISCTLAWVNAFNLLDFHKEWVEKGLIRIDDIMLNELDGPPYFSLKNIPDWKKQNIEKAYREHIEWLKSNHAERSTIFKFESVIGFMYTTINQTEEFPHEQFHWITQRLDKIRNESFFETYPEHTDMKEYLEILGYDFTKGTAPVHSISFDNKFVG